MLVVDDNATNRRILDEVLARWADAAHRRRRRARSASDLGTRRADGDPFHLVLLDAHMPGMDGFKLWLASNQIRGWRVFPT